MKNGCDVMATSTTADEILVDYELYQPDFLILDYKLPGGTNGLHCLKQEIEGNLHFKGKYIKVIMKPIQMFQLKSFVV
jgi:DNA-binding NarL/FixJ family response regulator